MSKVNAGSIPSVLIARVFDAVRYFFCLPFWFLDISSLKFATFYSVFSPSYKQYNNSNSQYLIFPETWISFGISGYFLNVKLITVNISTYCQIKSDEERRYRWV
jgi:hypothetical protein